ncbi:hypothetical protein [Dyella sp. GSA-30]|uniref:hypothetical protein n=1 Tax=Dyella sp. GSA-30 TaxID=2994496 RepID=UPI00249256E9|nr:hypothetical protein [Dyella sp. GSA-30]BDU18836.1 hypothetical protein DYGSA30_02930 [Dyella sp. GSA-30]
MSLSALKVALVSLGMFGIAHTACAFETHTGQPPEPSQISMRQVSHVELAPGESGVVTFDVPAASYGRNPLAYSVDNGGGYVFSNVKCPQDFEPLIFPVGVRCARPGNHPINYEHDAFTMEVTVTNVDAPQDQPVSSGPLMAVGWDVPETFRSTWHLHVPHGLETSDTAVQD